MRALLALLVLDDAPVEEVDRPLGVLGESRIVRDHADRRALAVQLAQQPHDRLAVGGVEVSGGLVGEQDERLSSDRARDSDALLLASESCDGKCFIR
jgi:hypothetical protein